MSRDGSGNYSLPEAAFAFNTVISQDAVNNNFSDIAAALTASIATDGQSAITANIPLSGYKLTGVGAGTVATDAVNFGQVQGEAFIWCGTAGGTVDAIELTPSLAITSYVAGQRFVWISAGDNTGAMTVAVSGLTTKAIENDGAAVGAAFHANGKVFVGIYDGTAFQVIRWQ